MKPVGDGELEIIRRGTGAAVTVAAPDFTFEFVPCLDPLDRFFPPKLGGGDPSKASIGKRPPPTGAARAAITSLLEKSLASAGKALTTSGDAAFFARFQVHLPALLEHPYVTSGCLTSKHPLDLGQAERGAIWRRNSGLRPSVVIAAEDDQQVALRKQRAIEAAIQDRLRDVTLFGALKTRFDTSIFNDHPAGVMAFLLSASALTTIQAELWSALTMNGQRELRLDADGNYSPTGDLAINSMQLGFQPPHQLVMRIDGSVRVPQALNYTLSFSSTVTDSFTVDEQGRLRCATTVDVSVDRTVSEAIIAFALPALFMAAGSTSGLLPGFGGAVFTPWAQAAAQSEFDFRVNGATRNVGSFQTLGSMIPGILPADVLLARTDAEKAAGTPGRKVAFRYLGVLTGPADGVLVWGYLELAADGGLALRKPSAFIVGPDAVQVPWNHGRPIQVSATFDVVTQDMRAPLQVQWTPQAHPASAGTHATLRFMVDPKRLAPHLVTALVTDADGNQVTASVEVPFVDATT